MAIINYRGVRVFDPPPTGDGGLLIQENLKTLADMSLGPVTVQSVAGPIIPANGLTYVNDDASAKVGFTLPDVAARSLHNLYIVSNINGIRITAPAGHRIQMAGAETTKSGGYIESITVGSVARLLKTGATFWVAIVWYGIWVVETS